MKRHSTIRGLCLIATTFSLCVGCGASGSGTQPDGGAGSNQGGAAGSSGSAGAEHTAGQAGAAGEGGGSAGAANAPDPGVTVLAPERLRVRQNSTAELLITVERSPDVLGPIDLRIHGLPTGVGAEAVTLEPPANSAPVTITALRTAQHGGPYSVTIEAVLADGSNETVLGRAGLNLYVSGAPGELDASFGDGGVVSQAIDSVFALTVRNAVLDAQSRLLVSATGGIEDGDSTTDQGFVLRFEQDGAPSSDFGPSGLVNGFGTPRSGATDVAPQGDSMVVGAFLQEPGGPYTHYVRRIDQHGEVDRSFGVGGDVLVNSRNFLRVRTWSLGAVLYDGWDLWALDMNGQPVAGFATSDDLLTNASQLIADARRGVFYGGGTANVAAYKIGKLTPTGQPDTSFGTDGVATFPMDAGDRRAVIRSLALHPENGGVALGSLSEAATTAQRDMAVLRWYEDGSFDTTFGGRGLAPIGASGLAREVLLQDDARILVLASQWTAIAESANYAVTRLTPDGFVDMSFAGDGTLEIDSESHTKAMVYESSGDRLYVVIEGKQVQVRRFWL